MVIDIKSFCGGLLCLFHTRVEGFYGVRTARMRRRAAARRRAWLYVIAPPLRQFLTFVFCLHQFFEVS